MEYKAVNSHKSDLETWSGSYCGAPELEGHCLNGFVEGVPTPRGQIDIPVVVGNLFLIASILSMLPRIQICRAT